MILENFLVLSVANARILHCTLFSKNLKSILFTKFRGNIEIGWVNNSSINKGSFKIATSNKWQNGIRRFSPYIPVKRKCKGLKSCYYVKKCKEGLCLVNKKIAIKNNSA